MTDTNARESTFRDLDLSAELLEALDDAGYETPSPIQIQAIPHLLKGQDLLGHAPTGTGKTAAFALPLISRIDTSQPNIQVMTLTPTRELAIQVAEAFQRYATHVPGFHVLPVYGGQDYGGQLRQLRRGVHVVVGTPGRVMDHMRRGTLKLDGLQALVLDEADEMLRMGFIDDVEWILEQTPGQRQMALFSATMPREVERIARRHLKEPHEVSIKARTATAETIRQRYWLVGGLHKLDALTRILEVESCDGILIFVRTRQATVELAERLEARGYGAAAMNGDMAQKQREQMIGRLKKGSLDILVATDVAARGLDVDRISHVINYDIPHDTEAYIHRIGRTGRAGRRGDAILFVAPRERRMLHAIERATRQKIDLLELPSTETVNNKRIADFKQRITNTLAAGELAFMQSLVEQYQQEHDVPAQEIAAALASMTIGDKSLLLDPKADKAQRRREADEHRRRKADEPHRETAARHDSARAKGSERGDRQQRSRQPDRISGPERPTGRKVSRSEEMERYRLEVGSDHGVEPRNIAGAILNEAGLDAEHIGQITIDELHSTVELPIGMPRSIFKDLKKVWVCGRQLHISRADGKTSRTGSVESGKHDDQRKNVRDKDTRKSKKVAAGKKGTPGKVRKKNKGPVSDGGKSNPGTRRKAGSTGG